MFDVVLRSYEALAGRKEPDAGTILAVVPIAICAEASHAVHQAEFERLDKQEKILKKELAVVHEAKAKLLRTSGHAWAREDYQRRRPLAMEQVSQFQKCARYWSVAELRRWFQPERDLWPPGSCGSTSETHKYFEEVEARYGENLRVGNTDLDPCLRFESWFNAGNGYIQGGIGLNVRVGMDAIDAVDHGIEITLALITVSHGHKGRYAKELAMMGFVREEAMAMRPGTYTNFATGFLAEAEVGRRQSRKRKAEVLEKAPEVDSEWAAAGEALFARRAAEWNR